MWQKSIENFYLKLIILKTNILCSNFAAVTFFHIFSSFLELFFPQQEEAFFQNPNWQGTASREMASVSSSSSLPSSSTDTSPQKKTKNKAYRSPSKKSHVDESRLPFAGEMKFFSNDDVCVF